MAILETLYSTGVRVSELVGLDDSDIDYFGGMIKVQGKGQEGETCTYWYSHAIKAIKEYNESKVKGYEI